MQNGTYYFSISIKRITRLYNICAMRDSGPGADCICCAASMNRMKTKTAGQCPAVILS